MCTHFAFKTIQLSVEILDHIFSFLVSHRETLITCSKDRVLSPIVERHLYYHVIVHFGHETTDDSNYAFKPDCLSKLISKNPRILYYVRILQIRVEFKDCPRRKHPYMKLLDEFANTLLMFPVLECIILTYSMDYDMEFPDVFQAALVDRLSCPTVKELHLEGLGGQRIPFSYLTIPEPFTFRNIWRVH